MRNVISRSARTVPYAHALRCYSHTNSPRVGVIGGGVAGLTSTLRILQSFGDRLACLDVLSDHDEEETASYGAAGVWGPYKMSDTPVEKLVRWGDETYHHLHALYHSHAALDAGVSLVSVHELSTEPREDPPWAAMLLQYQRIGRRQLAMFGPQYVDGIFYTAPVCEGRWYLPWLRAQIGHHVAQQVNLRQQQQQQQQALPPGSGGSVGRDSHGVDYRRELVESLEQLRGKYDVVINCAGLGAKRLLRDEACYPIRGQILRVRAPWVRHAYFAGDSYIIPNRDSVVLGGTGQVGDYNTAVSATDSARILAGACALLPSLCGAEVLSEWVGLRPGRTRVRLELEGGQGSGGGGTDAAGQAQTASGSGEVDAAVQTGRAHGAGGGRTDAAGPAMHVVHNYGHGGGGMSLAWGCAGEVVELLEPLLGEANVVAGKGWMDRWLSVARS